MINSFQDMQKFSQTNVDTAMKAFGDWNKSWQAIAAELTDFQKRSFEEGSAAMEKLMAAKSIEQAYEIQSSYAKRAYDDYMSQMTKIGSMYTNLAKDAYKPRRRLSSCLDSRCASTVVSKTRGSLGRAKSGPGLFCHSPRAQMTISWQSLSPDGVIAAHGNEDYPCKELLA